jgi:voltage-gated potassium channel
LKLTRQFTLLTISLHHGYHPSLENGAESANLKARQKTVLLSGITITFLKQFILGLWLTAPPLLTLAMFITLLGQYVGKKEGWSRFDSFYWSFITATTVGYGDLRPVSKGPRIVAILIALLGLTLSGILIAVAVHAATLALAAHDATAKIR